MFTFLDKWVNALDEGKAVSDVFFLEEGFRHGSCSSQYRQVVQLPYFHGNTLKKCFSLTAVLPMWWNMYYWVMLSL